MALRPLVLLISISCGASLGWYCGEFGGILGAYLIGVLGASIGLYVGRKIQRSLDGD